MRRVLRAVGAVAVGTVVGVGLGVFAAVPSFPGHLDVELYVLLGSFLAGCLAPAEAVWAGLGVGALSEVAGELTLWFISRSAGVAFSPLQSAGSELWFHRAFALIGGPALGWVGGAARRALRPAARRSG